MQTIKLQTPTSASAVPMYLMPNWQTPLAGTPVSKTAYITVIYVQPAAHRQSMS